MDNQILPQNHQKFNETVSLAQQAPTYVGEKSKKSLQVLILILLLFPILSGISGYHIGLTTINRTTQPSVNSQLREKRQLIVTPSAVSFSDNVEIITSSSPPTEESDWSTINDKIFTFKYPNSLIKKLYTTELGDEIDLFFGNEYNQSIPNFIISYQEPINKRLTSNKIRTETSDLIINNIQAKQIKHIHAQGEMTEIIFEKGDIKIHFWNNFDDLSSVKLFNSVINTFEFKTP